MAKRSSAVDALKADVNLSPDKFVTSTKFRPIINLFIIKIVPVMNLFLVSGIKAYQRLSRALFFRNCRFYPSCSHYAIEAIERFGIARGMKKAAARILRCSPATDGGYDPVR